MCREGRGEGGPRPGDGDGRFWRPLARSAAWMTMVSCQCEVGASVASPAREWLREVSQGGSRARVTEAGACCYDGGGGCAIGSCRRPSSAWRQWQPPAAPTGGCGGDGGSSVAACGRSR